MASNITAGCIVEFADKSKCQLGLVMQIDEKTGKLRMIQSMGHEISLPQKQIMHAVGARLSTFWPPSQIANELSSLEQKAKKLSQQIEIEEIWEILDENTEYSLEDLVSLRFTQPSGVERLAMIYALRNDKIFFKTLSPALYAKRPEDIVRDLQRQLQAKAEKNAWRTAFANEAAGLFNLPPQDRNATMRQLVLPHSEVKDAWKLIEDYALWGNQSKTADEAETLMDTLQSKINRGFSGSSYLRARTFLRESGYWTKTTHVPMLKYEISEFFEDNIESAAHAIFCQPVPAAGRLDLCRLNIFSIDDTETLDIDDALSIERLPNGYRLGIHIAAPASSIEFESPLEMEARRRATSVYLPECTVAMLPHILSENALSLMAGQKRAAMSFILTLDPEFNITDRQIRPTVICSKHRLSYDEAEHLLENGNDELSDDLRLIQEIAEFSSLNRHAHGAIDVDLPEFKLKYDAINDSYTYQKIDGQMMSRQLVAECMILANATAAEFCCEHKIPALYRIQPPPNNLPSQTTLDNLPNDDMRAYAIRRCMQPASNSLSPMPHAGLGIDKYLQATSPLRRYADLLCHYQLEYWFSHGTPRFDTETFNAILSETQLGLSHAKQASNEGNQVATYRYLQQLGATPLEAMILQYHTDRGDLAQVVLTDTQVRANVSTRKRWPLGTRCHVKIDAIHPEEITIGLRLIDIIEH